MQTLEGWVCRKLGVLHPAEEAALEAVSAALAARGSAGGTGAAGKAASANLGQVLEEGQGEGLEEPSKEFHCEEELGRRPSAQAVLHDSVLSHPSIAGKGVLLEASSAARPGSLIHARASFKEDSVVSCESRVGSIAGPFRWVVFTSCGAVEPPSGSSPRLQHQAPWCLAFYELFPACWLSRKLWHLQARGNPGLVHNRGGQAQSEECALPPHWAMLWRPWCQQSDTAYTACVLTFSLNCCRMCAGLRSATAKGKGSSSAGSRGWRNALLSVSIRTIYVLLTTTVAIFVPFFG